MTAPLAQHQAEIERNLRAWNAKPLLKEIYAGFYRRIHDRRPVEISYSPDIGQPIQVLDSRGLVGSNPTGASGQERIP